MLRFASVLFFAMLASYCPAQDAQGEKVVLLNKNPVDPRRYEDIRESPYLFTEFVDATIYQTGKDFLTGLKMNYNGHTESFEYKDEGKIFELDDTFFIKIEMISNKFSRGTNKYMSDTTTFVKGLDPNNFENFYMLVDGGKNATVFKDFTAYLSERKLENVGKTIDLKMFGNQFVYYLVKGGQTEIFKLRKRAVLDALSNREVTKYVKDRDLKLETEAELKQVLEFYNELELF